MMTKIIKACIIICIIGLFCDVADAQAQIKMPALFNDHMVLQRNSSVSVWGWTQPNKKVTAEGSWNHKSVTTIATARGKWSLSLATPGAGGPYKLFIKTSEHQKIINDVLIGEVWLASGQSNMRMPLKGFPTYPLKNSQQEIHNAEYPAIRLFTVKQQMAFMPQDSLGGAWVRCSPKTAANFSAAAYFFGRKLHKELHVPIGLINSSWSGTPAESWVSRKALGKINDFKKTLTRIENNQATLEKEQRNYDQQIQQWFANIGANRTHSPFTTVGYDDTKWDVMQLPQTLEKGGLGDWKGSVWFKKEITINHSTHPASLQLQLGPIDDMDDTYFNGVLIGKHNQFGQQHVLRSYPIPDSLVRAGKNQITVRVIDFGGKGGFLGQPKQMHIISSDSSRSGPESISLAGSWHYQPGLSLPRRADQFNQNTPSVLFDGMIAPLIPYTIRGAIWYQGESNVGRPVQYRTLFPSLINDWRTKWERGNFPFYFVQIAPFRYANPKVNLSALREAQKMALQLPNTGMAETMDIGNIDKIHPADKQDIGLRLAFWALVKTYHQKGIIYSGPLYKSMKISENKIILHFNHIGNGLKAKGDKLKHFIIAGSDENFVKARAVIRNSTVVVSSPKVPHPVAVRYGWSNTAQASLFNKGGLPASSFRTDNWKLKK